MIGIAWAKNKLFRKTLRIQYQEKKKDFKYLKLMII